MAHDYVCQVRLVNVDQFWAMPTNADPATMDKDMRTNMMGGEGYRCVRACVGARR